MKKYIHIFLCLTILLAGCAQKKNNTPSKNIHKTKKSQTKTNKKSSFDENLEAFALDDDVLHTFAHNKENTSEDTIEQKNKTMFAWQNATVDESKEEFKKIYFEFDKYTINKQQESALQADIEYAQKMINLGKIIVIEGHACDSAGSRIYNLTLSQKRAEYIAKLFINAGINKASIKIAARGQEMPIHKGGNKHQQAVNRRVEIYVIDK